MANKVDLTEQETLKLARMIKKDYQREKFLKKQTGHVFSFWDMLPFYMIFVLAIGTIIVLISQLP